MTEQSIATKGCALARLGAIGFAAIMLSGVDGVRCFKPDATFYLFPNVTEVMKRKGVSDYGVFRREALEATGVSFCTRTHFGRPLEGETEYYIRLAYSGIDVADIGEALERFKDFAQAAD